LGLLIYILPPKKFFIFLRIIGVSIILLLSGCSTSTFTPSESNRPLLSQRNRNILNLAVDLQHTIAQNVWPGFEGFQTAVVFLSPEGQFLFNSQGNPPLEYKAIGRQGIKWSNKDYKTDTWIAPDGKPFSKEEFDQGYLANAFSVEQSEGHFPYSVFFLDSIERFHQKGMKWSPDDWLSIFWHEVFHNFQDSLYAPELVVSEITNFANIKPYVESEKFLELVRHEQRILMTALKKQKLKDKRKTICMDFLNARKKRYKSMNQLAVTSEKFYEISEGTARYVEELMSLEAGRIFSAERVRSSFKIIGFEHFEKYAKKNLASYYEKLDTMSTSMKYFYNTGFGLALLLDQINPLWKKTAFQTKGFLFTTVEQWCRR